MLSHFGSTHDLEHGTKHRAPSRVAIGDGVRESILPLFDALPSSSQTSRILCILFSLRSYLRPFGRKKIGLTCPTHLGIFISQGSFSGGIHRKKLVYAQWVGAKYARFGAQFVRRNGRVGAGRAFIAVNPGTQPADPAAGNLSSSSHVSAGQARPTLPTPAAIIQKSAATITVGCCRHGRTRDRRKAAAPPRAERTRGIAFADRKEHPA